MTRSHSPIFSWYILVQNNSHELAEGKQPPGWIAFMSNRVAMWEFHILHMLQYVITQRRRVRNIMMECPQSTHAYIILHMHSSPLHLHRVRLWLGCNKACSCAPPPLSSCNLPLSPAHLLLSSCLRLHLVWLLRLSLPPKAIRPLPGLPFQQWFSRGCLGDNWAWMRVGERCSRGLIDKSWGPVALLKSS